MANRHFSFITQRIRNISILLVCVVFIATLTGASAHQAQAAATIDPASPGAPAVSVGSGFTYQGRLTEGGNPANGQYDFRFTLFDALTGGNQIGPQIALAGQTVTDGLFTVTLDFGPTAFAGDARYLQLEVRQTGGSTYTLLSPRQSLTGAPYALGLRPGTVVSGGAPGAVLGLINSTSQATGLSGTADNGSSAKGVYGESLNGYGGYFQSTSGDGLYASGADGIDATGAASGGAAVRGTANNGTTARGILGISSGGSGVYGTSSTGYGGNFSSTSGTGVTVTGGNGTYSVGTASNGAGLWGVANVGTTAKGVYGTSSTGYGVYGTSTASNGTGVYGAANTGTSASGVYGTSSAGNGVYGVSTATNGKGVYGVANAGSSASGVYGASTTGYGVYASGGTGVYATGSNGIYSTGTGSNGVGVWGVANNGATAKGVYGTSSTGAGVYGTSTASGGYGVVGLAANGLNAAGVYGSASTTGDFGVEGVSPNAIGIYGVSSTGWAGYFSGNVHVSGSCCGAGALYTSIDDPLDPQSKDLNQSVVQSPDMLTVINGNVTTNEQGAATVQLPAYFEAANQDFRYQLTVIGQFAQAIVATEVKDNSFTIKSDGPNVKVSWQVTGVRKDSYAKEHPIQAETAKPLGAKDAYIYPDRYGQAGGK